MKSLKIELIIGFLCLTIIIVSALALGYNGVLAGAGLSVIGGLLGWQSKKQLDKKGGNTEALAASLQRAGFTDAKISNIIKAVKTRR